MYHRLDCTIFSVLNSFFFFLLSLECLLELKKLMASTIADESSRRYHYDFLGFGKIAFIFSSFFSRIFLSASLSLSLSLSLSSVFNTVLSLEFLFCFMLFCSYCIFYYCFSLCNYIFVSVVFFFFGHKVYHGLINLINQSKNLSLSLYILQRGSCRYVSCFCVLLRHRF